MKHSSMQPVGFRISYINDYPQELTEKDEYLPATYAMHWCMTATYMNRLFTKQDMHEFLFRLAITLDTLKVMENWFAYEKILNFSLNGKQYSLSANDIIFHYGLEVTDSIRNGADREFYMENISKGIFNAMFIGALSDYHVIAPAQTGEHTAEISGSRHTPVITDQLLKNAEFFAADILKLAQKDHFNRSNGAKTDKLNEIEERKKAIADLPEFDITEIPDETIHECLELMLHPDHFTYLTEKAEKDEYEEEVFDYIYFAWLWANDLMVSDGETACEVEGVILDHDRYELHDEDGGGINLLQTYYNHNVEEVIPLLKGMGMKQKN